MLSVSLLIKGLEELLCPLTVYIAKSYDWILWGRGLGKSQLRKKIQKPQSCLPSYSSFLRPDERRARSSSYGSSSLCVMPSDGGLAHLGLISLALSQL